MQFKATTRFANANTSNITSNNDKNNNSNVNNYSDCNSDSNNKVVIACRDFALIYLQLQAKSQQQQQQQQNEQHQSAHKMQITAIAEVKCICTSPHYATTTNNNHNNKNHNNNNYKNSESNAQLDTCCTTKTATTTAATLVCNVAAATIPAAMTDDSGCCCKCASSNMQHCGKDVDCSAPSASATATAAVACPNQRSTPTHCCQQDTGSLSLSKNNNNNQHNCKDNFVASESKSAIADCKHSAVIRNSSSGGGDLPVAAAAETKATTSTKTRATFNIASWKNICAMLMLLFCFARQDHVHAALSNVNLFIEPPAVRRGQSVTLRCHYALEGAPLYSIKYYRGNYEFYRYTPGEFPNVKYFQYPGIRVDELISNATQVVVRDVSFSLSGNFSCEVTADSPLYSTSTAYAQVQVVEFPEKRPQLFTEHSRYEIGDILRANCSTPPSRPRADLHFTINNIPVSTGETQYIRTVDNLIASRLSLKLQLHAAHFAAVINTQHLMNHLGGSQSAIGLPYNTQNGGGGAGVGAGVGVGIGGLVLRCTAQIGDLYQEYKEIELGTPQKDPVPARVTLSSSSSLRNFFETYFSSATSSATTSSMVHPLKLTALAAAVCRSQALLLGLAAGAVSIYNTLRLKPAAIAIR